MPDMKLVPVEPDEAMVDAAVAEFKAGRSPRNIVHAAIAAASPASPSPGADVEGLARLCEQIGEAFPALTKRGNHDQLHTALACAAAIRGNLPAFDDALRSMGLDGEASPWWQVRDAISTPSHAPASEASPFLRADVEGVVATPGRWSQGGLLLTAKTRRWSKDERERAHAEERRCVYANFTPADEGRSRRLVAQFRDEADAQFVVAALDRLAHLEAENGRLRPSELLSDDVREFVEHAVLLSTNHGGWFDKHGFKAVSALCDPGNAILERDHDARAALDQGERS